MSSRTLFFAYQAPIVSASGQGNLSLALPAMSSLTDHLRRQTRSGSAPPSGTGGNPPQQLVWFSSPPGAQLDARFFAYLTRSPAGRAISGDCARLYAHNLAKAQSPEWSLFSGDQGAGDDCGSIGWCGCCDRSAQCFDRQEAQCETGDDAATPHWSHPSSWIYRGLEGRQPRRDCQNA